MNELVTIGKRLKDFLETKKMKVNELGRLSQTSGTQIYNIVKGKKYGVDKFISVVKELPDLNIYWLLFGEGSMYKEGSSIHSLSSSEVELLKKEVEKLNSIIVYQELSLNAYKRSLDMASVTNEDLKKLIEFYKTQAESLREEKKIKSA